MEKPIVLVAADDHAVLGAEQPNLLVVVGEAGRVLGHDLNVVDSDLIDASLNLAGHSGRDEEIGDGLQDSRRRALEHLEPVEHGLGARVDERGRLVLERLDQIGRDRAHAYIQSARHERLDPDRAPDRRGGHGERGRRPEYRNGDSRHPDGHGRPLPELFGESARLLVLGDAIEDAEQRPHRGAGQLGRIGQRRAARPEQAKRIVPGRAVIGPDFETRRGQFRRNLLEIVREGAENRMKPARRRRDVGGLGRALQTLQMKLGRCFRRQRRAIGERPDVIRRIPKDLDNAGIFVVEYLAPHPPGFIITQGKALDVRALGAQIDEFVLERSRIELDCQTIWIKRRQRNFDAKLGQRLHVPVDRRAVRAAIDLRPLPDRQPRILDRLGEAVLDERKLP